MNWVDEMEDCGAVYEITMVPHIWIAKIRFDNEHHDVIVCDGWRDAVSEHHRSCAMRQGKVECTCL